MVNSKTIIIFGATGLIGRELVQYLYAKEYHIIVITRNYSKAYKIFGDKVTIAVLNAKDTLGSVINGSFAVVNLVGENIATYWSESNKRKILSSRVSTSKAIADAINCCTNPPQILVQASAIGFYNFNTEIELTEESPKGEGFLSEVVEKWEESVKSIKKDVRIVFIRTGVVLSKSGGFLKKLLLPIRLFFGGWFGKGTQIISWIHINDHIHAIHFLIENSSSNGIYNLVSPEPISQKELLKRVGKKLNRPAIFSIPSFLVRLVFGKMADEVLLANQTVKPSRILNDGFTFEFSDINSGLDNLLGNKKIN